MIAAHPPTLVHTPPPVASPPRTDICYSPLEQQEYAPIADIAREMSRELQGDGVLVAWHDASREAVFLFADGACEPHSPIERDMAVMAVATARGPHATARSHWQAAGDGAAGALLTTGIAAEGGLVTVTTLFKQIGASTRMRAAETAARLLPLIQPFFRMWTLRLRTAARLRGLTAAVDHSDVGVVLVSRRGQIMFANPAAETLLAQNDGLRRSGTMLTGEQLADTLRLHATIDHVIGARTVAKGRPATPIVTLQRQSGRPLLAAVVSIDEPSAAAGDAAAVVYVFDSHQDLHPLVEPVCRLYGLSPVETRLACLLADGTSLADAAAAMHVREQTARSYLKQVFLKTETNRQAELVWLMLKSSVRATGFAFRV